MAIYAKTITEEQRKCFEQFESLSGFEIMFQEEVDSGEITFWECWDQNIQWMESLMATLTNIKTPDEPEEFESEQPQ